MSDLIEFLRARLDEEQDLARRAAFGWGAEWTAVRDEDDWARVTADGSLNVAGSEDVDVIRHAACWDPARVLAEIAAKRAAIDEHVVDDDPTGEGVFCNSCDRFDYPCRTLRALAQPYSSHPDYDPEWTP